ncbi:MAG: hypothetical protein SGJ03_10200 [Alphaproteobacteria bacterium]|nr:hypothetical protein [Alphaproteobacteria bacterium]
MGGAPRHHGLIEALTWLASPCPQHLDQRPRIVGGEVADAQALVRPARAKTDVKGAKNLSPHLPDFGLGYALM